MPDPDLPIGSAAETLARLEARLHAEATAATLARLEERINAHEALTTAQMETFLVRLEGESARTRDALAAGERAVAKAEVANDARFASVNEFRAQLTDQASRFATRETVDVIAASSRERLDTVTAASRDFVTQLGERIRGELDEVKAQSNRLLYALGTTIIGTLVAALVVMFTRR